MFADEEPTRPDLPQTTARKCLHCGLVYGDHKRTKCNGRRREYTPEPLSEADRAR